MNKKIEKKDIYAGHFGFCVADAIGVPGEFKDRNYFKKNPITDMTGFGTHNQPPGSWSDDSSLAFCLTESLSKGYNPSHLANNFIKWFLDGYLTPSGKVFDIGNTTSASIRRLMEGVPVSESGGKSISENGNGSLMRIFPLVYYIYNKNLNEDKKFSLISEISGITHAHIYSVLCCYIYIDFSLSILNGLSIKESFDELKTNKFKYYKYLKESEKIKFQNILENNLEIIPEDEIHSSGYALHSLEASLWCLLSTTNYSDAILKAVNLGSDTDTTACITGGPAGIFYGFDSIPKKWINGILKKEEIFKLCDDFYNSLN